LLAQRLQGNISYFVGEVLRFHSKANIEHG